MQNLDQLYVLVSSAHKTTRCDMTCTVVESAVKPQINKLELIQIWFLQMIRPLLNIERAPLLNPTTPSLCGNCLLINPFAPRPPPPPPPPKEIPSFLSISWCSNLGGIVKDSSHAHAAVLEWHRQYNLSVSLSSWPRTQRTIRWIIQVIGRLHWIHSCSDIVV